MKILSLIGVINLVCSNLNVISNGVTKFVSHDFDEKVTINIKSGDIYYGNLNFQNKYQNALYRIITSGNADTKLELYENNIKIAENDNDGGSKNSVIYTRLNVNNEYHYKLTVTDNSYKDVTIDFDPEYPLYFNSLNTNINTISEVNDTISPMNSLGYYVYNTTNESLFNLNKLGTNDRNKYNNKYYFISSHGSEDGYVRYNASETTKYTIYKDMSNCDVAVFAICHGGKTGNVAEMVTKNKNCKNAIGWPGKTYTNTSPVFTKELFNRFSYGDNIYEAAKSALKKVNSTFWFNIGIESDDTIEDYRIYGVKENLLTSNNVNTLNSFNNSKYLFKKENLDFKNFKQINVNGKKYYVFINDGVYTNYFLKEINENYYSNQASFDFDLLKEEDEILNFNKRFYLKDGNKYRNILEIQNNNDV